MTSKELRWVIYFSIFVIVVTTVPYLIGYFREGSNWQYTGFVFGVEDGNSYIAKMLSGAFGAWLFRTPYTAYPQAGFLAFLPYILLGKLSSAPGQHEQLVALFQIFRWIGIFLFVIASYDFVGLFIKEVWHRRLAVAVICLGGGLGWLVVLGLKGLWKDGLPLEFYSPESFGFLSLYGVPHLAVGRALLLWGLYKYLGPVDQSQDRRRGILGGILWFGLGLIQPLTVAVGWIILAAHLGFSGIVQLSRKFGKMEVEWIEWKRYFQKALIIGVISSPLVIYNMVSFLTDPYLKGWEQQNIITSPPPLDYLLAYGLLLPFALAGIRNALGQNRWSAYLLIAWLIILPALAYAPTNLQRRLPEGVWVAIVILAVVFFANRSAKSKRWLKPIYGLSFLTTLLLIAGGLISVWQTSNLLFRSNGEVDMFNFLSKQTPGQVVLASFVTSNALPAWAPLRTIVGHGPESIHLKEIEPQVDQFYSGSASDQAREQLLEKFNIAFVIWGPAEQKMGSWNPAGASYLKIIYQNNGYSIFQVNHAAVTAK
ncbi:MAG: hypothetical protein P4L50_14800 [Anaerolineaceae bacterium]|nr:hypothetical protein [Anaerolineaceae bacterium]